MSSGPLPLYCNLGPEFIVGHHDSSGWRNETDGRADSRVEDEITELHRGIVFSVWLMASAVGQTSTGPFPAPSDARLPGEEVVQRMIQRNLERASALRAFEATRTYRLEYRGFPSNREAEMVASVVYQAPESKSRM
jgi:hypothetical protein